MGPDAPRPVIECVSLLRVFESATGRVQAVRGVDLTIESGRAVAVVGPSGSGKSSLLRMIGGLDEPTAGDVSIDGVNLVELSGGARRRMRARLLSHVHQQPMDNLLGHLTALDQVVRVADRRGAGLTEAREMLTSLGLAHREDHLPHQLSGGEQQRLAFARGAVGSPAVIIADEPTAELDSESTDRVLDAVEQLSSEGITVLLATHDRRVIERVDEVVTLRDGSISSVTAGGSELAVIDHAGRIQLPPEVRDQFPDRRARISWDRDRRTLTVEEP
ncbi:MAG: ATP-binding cassette domain-containing protein [Actinomycetota bacterium]